MDNYIIVKKVTLQAGNKEFHKDRIITAADVGQANIDRYLQKGYIQQLGNTIIPFATSVKDGLPFYMTADDFLTPEQVNSLSKKAQLVEYAGHIGVTGFKANISAVDLKSLINQFIVEANNSVDDDEPEEEPEVEP